MLKDDDDDNVSESICVHTNTIIVNIPNFFYRKLNCSRNVGNTKLSYNHFINPAPNKKPNLFMGVVEKHRLPSALN